MSPSVSAYFTSSPFISSSLSFLATLAVLAWAYRRTRLPAAAAYLAWKLASYFAVPWVTQALFSARTSGQGGAPPPGPVTLDSPLGLWGMLVALLDAGLFVWLLVSLVGQARPSPARPDPLRPNLPEIDLPPARQAHPGHP